MDLKITAKEYITSRLDAEYAKIIQIRINNIPIFVMNGLFHEFFATELMSINTGNLKPDVNILVNFVGNFLSSIFINNPTKSYLKQYFNLRCSIGTVFCIYELLREYIRPNIHISLIGFIENVKAILKEIINTGLRRCQTIHKALYITSDTQFLSESVTLFTGKRMTIIQMRTVIKSKKIFLMPKEVIDYALAECPWITSDLIDTFIYGYGVSTLHVNDFFDHIYSISDICRFDGSLYNYYTNISNDLCCPKEDFDIFMNKIHNHLYARIDHFDIVEQHGIITARIKLTDNNP